MPKFLIITLLFFVGPSMFSQTTIEGKILSQSSIPIGYGSIIIKDSKDKILKYTYSQSDGTFHMKINQPPDTILIEVNKMGFIRYQKQIDHILSKNIHNIEIMLDEVSTELEDIVIEIDNPIKIKGDTLEFDAKAFSTGREVVVEDLLKNIPGVTVDSDGTIKYEDQKIEKVMVEGDDLFNRGYSLLTKNMPSKPLSKVQVLKRYSNNRLLKGIEESDKVALNLTIQDEFRDIWFGDLTVGYGLISENRYDANGNLMNFSKKYKNFLSSGLNNTGSDRIGTLEDMFYNNTEVESVGNGAQLRSIMNMNGGRAGELKDHRTRINNVEYTTLSTIFPIKEKFKIKISGFLGFDENYAFRSQRSVFNAADQYFENVEQNNFRSHLKKIHINLLGTYDISATKMLQFSSVYSTGHDNNNNGLRFNGIETSENLNTKNVFFDQKLTYTMQWKEKHALLIKARFFTNDLPQIYKINDYLMGDLFDFDANSVSNKIHNNKSFVGIETDLKIQQKGGSTLDFQAGFLYDHTDLQTDFTLYSSMGQLRPEDFQTNSSFTYSDLYARSGYTWKKEDFKLTGKVEIHQLFNSFTGKVSSDSSSPFYLNPSLNAKWELNSTNSITSSYLLNFQNTSNSEVNNTYLLTSSRGFTKGLGEFNLTDFQMANLSYNIRHYLNRYRFSLVLNYRTQNKVVATRSTIEQNSALAERMLLKGGKSYGIGLNSNFTIKSLESIIFFEAGYSRGTYYNEVNNSGLRENNTERKNIKLGWRSTFHSFFNFHAGGEWLFNKVETSDFTSDFVNGFNYLDLFFELNEHFNAKIVSEHYYFGNLPQNQRNHYFVDFETSYKFKGDKYTLSVRGNNLLNKTEFSTFYVSDLGYSTTSYRLIPRFFLASFKVRFQ